MNAPSLDPRRNVFRADLAAEALRGRVAAPRYVAGEPRQVVHSASPVRATPNALDSWTTEVLFGELVTVYEERDGWAWVQLARDGYVGYMRAAALTAQVRAPTHRVKALGTSLYPAPDIKASPWLPISMNALLCVVELGQTFSKLADGSFVPTRHIVELDRFAPDFVAVAERFAGVPYLWGGRSRLGVDCSGLVQVALQAAGVEAPRDSDMQQAELGDEVAAAHDLDGLMRGDLVFWRGHVGIMLDGFLMLHANAHHMAVVAELLSGAVDRIASTGNAITAIKRLPRRPAPAAAARTPAPAPDSSGRDPHC
jgi:cell wall-associated NlpC family hydrolase